MDHEYPLQLMAIWELRDCLAMVAGRINRGKGTKADRKLHDSIVKELKARQISFPLIQTKE